MKKFTLTIVLFVASFAINAQTLTLKTGPTLSKMTWKNSISTINSFDNEYVGFTSTLGFDYLHRKNFTLSSNVGYANIGGYSTMPATDPNNPENDEMTDFKTTLHFLTVNTIAQLKFNVGKNISPFIGIGPRLDFLVNYKEDVGLLVQFENVKELNKHLYGLIGVAGINYNMNKFRFGLEFQYNYTLNKLVNNTSEWNVKNEISVAYYDVAVSIGYKLK